MKNMCLRDCSRCENVCRKDLFHTDECSCGVANCAWMASDFPPEPIYEAPVKSEPVNEKAKTCMCPVDCACRGSTCDRRAPHECQLVEPKVPDTISGYVCDHTTLTPLPEKHLRPLWHETWMETAHAVGKRSYDPRLQVGAIVVSEDNTVVLSLGYNGNFAGGPNVPDSLEPGQSGFIHAEANCLIKCPYHYPLKKVMYVTHSPCKNCAKMIVNAGIARVIYDIEYRDTSGIELMRSVGILVEKFSDLVNQR